MPESKQTFKKRLFSSRPSYNTLVQLAKEAQETKGNTENIPVKAQLEAFLDKQNTRNTDSKH
jgi:hypothetical protein